MKRGLLLLLLVLASCGQPDKQAVALRSVEVSPDRRTLTVETPYPVRRNCAKLPDGVDVEIRADVVIVAAYARVERGLKECTAECGSITQVVTLDEPLPDGVQFRAPDDADPGC